jgi:hypothetical protein
MTICKTNGQLGLKEGLDKVGQAFLVAIVGLQLACRPCTLNAYRMGMGIKMYSSAFRSNGG